jgi:hypothetical protein
MMTPVPLPDNLIVFAKKHHPDLQSKNIYIREFPPSERLGNQPPSQVFINVPASEDGLGPWLEKIISNNDNVPYLLFMENLLVVTRLEARGSLILKFSAQLFYADGPLGSTIQQGGRIRYARFDYDPTALGTFFTHPLPHFHTQINGGPRFFMAHLNPNVVAGFLDWLMVHFRTNDWLEWVKAVTRARLPGAVTDVDLALDNFAKSNVPALRKDLGSEGSIIRKVRKCLHEEWKIHLPWQHEDWPADLSWH